MSTKLYVVQQYWGSTYGWEDVYASEDPLDARARLTEYRQNQPEVPARLVVRFSKDGQVSDLHGQQLVMFETLEDIKALKPKRHSTRFTKGDIDSVLSEIRELHDRLNETLLYSKSTDRPAIHSPGDAAQLIMPLLSPLENEELWVILLDTRNRVIKCCQLYKGSVNNSQVRVGEVFREAVRNNSPSIVVVHNHPSGDPTPSPDDVAITRAIVQAGKLLDIEPLDHLVIGANKWVSLKERGLGFS